MSHQRLTRFHLIVGSAVIAIAVICAVSNGPLRWILLSGLCTCAGTWIGLGVAFPRLQMFGHSLCSFKAQGKTVALTFDDGPDPEVTPAVLKILAERGAPATFFCVGRKVREFPELARRIVAEGHRVENHSYGHSNWTNFFSVGRLRDEIARAQREIESATGRVPKLYRPPMGLTNLRVFKAASELGLMVVGYSARGLDRRPDSPEQIAARLLDGVEPGAVLLLHDSGITAEKAGRILTLVFDRLKTAGFECRLLETGDGCGVKPSIAPSTEAS